MSGYSAPKSASGERNNVRVVVVGDRATGKSSLIAAAASESFPDSVAPVLPPTRLPSDFYPDNIPVTIIDTPSSLEGKAKLEDELKRADAVVLTYACDRPETLNRLKTFWLLELRRLKVKVPVIVVGCKLDLRDEQAPMSLEQVMAPIMQQFREIETCIECSAASLVQESKENPKDTDAKDNGEAEDEAGDDVDTDKEDGGANEEYFFLRASYE